MDYIELKEIAFHAYHGVLEQERMVGNTYTVQIKLFLDLTKAMESDKIEDTVNYAKVYEVIKKEMEIPSSLLEHIAGRIIGSLKKEFPQIKVIDIRLAKKNPPMGAAIQEAAVRIKS